jgi:type IV secretory pathway component VirB8
MVQEKKEELKTKEELEQLAEYQNFVKESTADGSYFKDALDWYFFRYVNPVCDRTLMAFIAIVAAVAMCGLVQIINTLFPLVEKAPIVITAKDQSLYTPYIKPLKGKDDRGVTVDIAILKYLLSVYVIDRESYDYRKSEVEDINKKFRRIRNTSSFAEYKNFQAMMSKDNPDSPLNNFGQNVYRTVEVQYVDFDQGQAQDYYSILRTFFSITLPKIGNVKFVTTTHSFDDNNVEQTKKESYLAKLKFDFTGVDREAKTGVLNFSVNSYKLYKVK